MGRQKSESMICRRTSIGEVVVGNSEARVEMHMSFESEPFQ